MVETHLHASSPVSASSSEETLVDGTPANTSDAKQQESSPLPSPSPPASSSKMEHVPLLLAEAPSIRPTTIQFQTTPKKSVPRLNTRTSISSPALPWQVDTTSSPSSASPSSAGYYRKPSFVPPPPARPGVNNCMPSVSSSSPPVSQLQPDSPLSPLSAYHHAPPYAMATSSSSLTSSGHVIDLSHPPGYAQNAKASFSDRASYGNNQTPFYENNNLRGASLSFSGSGSGSSSPFTPTRRGRGILDNDPAIYLAGEGDADEDSVWDTAARWAKAAGKRLSQGEQQIWRLVSAIGNGDVEMR